MKEDEKKEEEKVEEEEEKYVWTENIIFNLYGKSLGCCLKWRVLDSRYEVIEEVVREMKSRFTYNETAKKWDIMWQDSRIKPPQIARMRIHQRFNHLPGMQCLANKENLGKNLKKLQEKFPEEYNFFPKTWILPENVR